MRRLLVMVFFVALCVAAPSAHAGGGLEQRVLEAVQSAGFDRVLDGDRGPNPTAPWYEQIAHTPQVDVAVIKLNGANRATDAVNVLMSRDYPRGVVVPLGRDYETSAVRYRKWNLERWEDNEDGVRWTDPWPASEDIVPGRENAPINFMTPYPASVLKVMVAYGISRLVDKGRMRLDAPVTYTVASGQNCYAPDADTTETVRQWMTLMITESSNVATCALIQQLHQLTPWASSTRTSSRSGCPH
jgi:hypothetical protein